VSAGGPAWPAALWSDSRRGPGNVSPSGAYSGRSDRWLRPRQIIDRCVATDTIVSLPLTDSGPTVIFAGATRWISDAAMPMDLVGAARHCEVLHEFSDQLSRGRGGYGSYGRRPAVVARLPAGPVPHRGRAPAMDASRALHGCGTAGGPLRVTSWRAIERDGLSGCARSFNPTPACSRPVLILTPETAVTSAWRPFVGLGPALVSRQERPDAVNARPHEMTGVRVDLASEGHVPGRAVLAPNGGAEVPSPAQAHSALGKPPV